jgi:hypothetical protein
MNWLHQHFRYTNATIFAIVSALITVAVTFGLHLTQDNIRTVMNLVGILLGVTVAGAGVKSAGLIRAGVLDGVTAFHFTPAVIVSAIGSALALAVSFGLHLTEEDIASIMRLVELIGSGIVLGGAAKSHALLRAGIHPLLTRDANYRAPGTGTPGPGVSRR